MQLIVLSMKSKYIIRSRISERKFREILRLFCLDIEACKVAQITAISRPHSPVVIPAVFKRESSFVTGE